jgi:peptide chain release factor 3
VFGRDRETLDEAYPGDIVGFVGRSMLGIGDTLTQDPAITYEEIPRFPPEAFMLLSNPNPSAYKRFREGVDQLLQEGVVQGFTPLAASQQVPILAAVGPLQFEVFQYRLENEYGATSRLEPTEWKFARWVDPAVDQSAIAALSLPSGTLVTRDAKEQLVLLFPGEWALTMFREKHPAIGLGDLPFTSGGDRRAE